MTNGDIADALDELGDLYELDGAVHYRVIAYHNAAKAIRDAAVSVEQLVRDGRVTELPGIGKTLESKLARLVEHGEMEQSVKLRERFPDGVVAMTRLPGFGPKRARKVYEELGIDSLDALRAAAEGQRLRALSGFGARAEEKLLAALQAGHDGAPPPRWNLARALPIADQIVAVLRAVAGVTDAAAAGSLRRCADAVKDLDIVVATTDPEAAIAAFVGQPTVADVQASGDAGARIVLHSGLAVDLKVVAPDQFGNALQHFTGSKAHNVALREAAVRRGLHVSEYGIVDDADGSETRCATEPEVYERLGLAWVPPELREDRGEFSDAIPELVEVGQIRGDLHCHTVLSDGRAEIEELVAAARARGYEYLALTDHSATHGFGDHVTAEQLYAQIERVRAIDAQLDGFDLLIGTETNVLPDGRVDYDDELLAELDWVIASVHTSFAIPAAEMTARIVAAIENPHVDAIGHPTGRKITSRAAYAVDLERVIEAAARTGTMLEINASPERRDLNEIHARAAARAGVPIVINSDAHALSDLDNMRFGIATARRAWLTAADVANTRPWRALAELRS